MIDLHNHILAGVDDGAADMEESLAIARQFLSEGVATVAATPHLDALNGRGPSGPDVRERVQALNRALGEAEIGLAVLPAQEIFLTPDVPALLERGAAIPVAGGPWVLLELPFDHRPLYLDDTLFRLELAGYRPILAHPERYTFVRNDSTSLDDAVGRGLLLQLTAPSLLGEYGASIRRTAEHLLRAGMYGLAASDRHHPGTSRSLTAARDRITSLTDEGTTELLLETNPMRVIAGQEIDLPEPSHPPSRSLLGRLFRSG